MKNRPLFVVSRKNGGCDSDLPSFPYGATSTKQWQRETKYNDGVYMIGEEDQDQDTGK